MNRVKTAMLLAALTALVTGLGYALAGRGGLVIALVLGGVMNFAAYWFSDKIVLRMHGAREVSPAEAPQLYGMVQELALKANMPMPKVYVMPEDAPNAFATGRNPKHAAVAVTEGITRLLDQRELRGVLAHELGHVKNRDTLIMTVSAAFAGAMSTIANLAMWNALLGGGDDEDSPNPIVAMLGMLVAPIAATLIQLAISRSREYLADEWAGRLTGDTLALASALRKIEAWSARVPMHAGAPATAHLFIINPFSAGGLAGLFSTHPATAERVRRLEALA
jgi:heat shock protein HtpX